MSYKNHPIINPFEANCCIAYVTACLYLSIKPYFFSIWLVENITVWLFLILILYIRVRHCQFSKISLFLITVASILHTIGGHYGFSNVPLGKSLVFFGEQGRNNFDRMGHFFCGTLTYVILDVTIKKQIFTNNILMYCFAFLAMTGIAGIYELLEWLDFIIAEKEHAELFLGDTINPWDPHADVLNCVIGSICAMICFIIFNRKRAIHLANKSEIAP